MPDPDPARAEVADVAVDVAPDVTGAVPPPWHALTPVQVLQASEVAACQARHGDNALPAVPPKPLHKAWVRARRRRVAPGSA